MKNNEKGLIHIYFGDGKGKSTAAAGLAARASGHGGKVVFAQFLKAQETGEIVPLERLGVKIIRSDETKNFTWQMTEEQKENCRNIQSSLLDQAEKAVREEGADLLVLDEALNAVSTNMLDSEKLKKFLENKPENLEIVLTGFTLPEGFESKADYITEMKKRKHPFDNGVLAREAIEY